MLLALTNEAGQTVTLWQDYLSVLLDPAHILAEVTYILLLDVLLLGLLVPVVRRAWRRRVRRLHEEIDREHGVECPET